MMMMAIVDEARKIGELLRASEEYQRLLLTENAVQADEAASDLFHKFKSEQNRIRNNSMAGKNPSELDIATVKELKEKMSQNKLIDDYEKASQEFNQLLDQVNMAIEQALSGMDPHACTHCGRH
jgi:cell fate (sporulation/competence/biofilm development) regulator YlbF (YheA/YmcA/DUF963 family)